MSSLYHLMAAILAGCFAATHDYALAIALLTLATVAITTPLTWKSSRGMIAMQALQPEMKKLQAKYKGDRAALNEEMSKLYRENGINPLAGCLPLVPQMVVFYILYHTISNLSHRLTFTSVSAAVKGCPPSTPLSQIVHTAGKYTCSAPANVSHTTLIYRDLIASGGHMKVFGFDLATGVTTAHGSAMIGCWILVALVVGAQYFQTRQVNRRNPAAASNPQAKMMQRVFPLFFGLISIKIQAAVNVYFLVSALCRIAQQSLMFRYDPILKRQLEAARTGKPVELPPRSVRAATASPGTDAPSPAPAPARGGGIARLLGLADAGAGAAAAQQQSRPGNLDRFLGDKNGAKGTLSNGSRDASAPNGSNPAASSNGATGARRTNTGRGPGGRGAPPQPPRPNDRNRSRSKKSRRAR